jgi:hypothetical protein
MFEAVPQELKESVEKALRKASREAYYLAGEAEKLVDAVSEQLDAWADELSDQKAGTDDDPSSKYQYLLRNSSGDEHERFVRLGDFLLHPVNAEILDALYESKKREQTGPVESKDFWSVLKEGFKE